MRLMGYDVEIQPNYEDDSWRTMTVILMIK